MDNVHNPDDELKADSAVMKLKLELEHGMQMSNTEGLDPKVENQWLQYFSNFEKLSKETPRIKVYDFIGRPTFIPLRELNKNRIADELNKLEALLDEKGVALDYCCEYEAHILYRFITEELFDYEMQGIHLKGMVHQFTYEDFHPNHDYDIRRLAIDFVEHILIEEWNEKFHGIDLAEIISFNGTDYVASGISTIIRTFQAQHPSCAIEDFTVANVMADVEAGRGTVTANLVYTINDASPRKVEGECFF